LANQFCDIVKLAGRKANKRFVFGTTSGCDYPVIKPKIPWSAFVAHSDAVYPQTYWAPNFKKAKRTTPDAAYKIGMDAWQAVVPQSMNMVPIMGEISTNKPDEINRFGEILAANGEAEVHIYTYSKALLNSKYNEMWSAVRNLGSTALIS
jgi:hypothetical protein